MKKRRTTLKHRQLNPIGILLLIALLNLIKMQFGIALLAIIVAVAWIWYMGGFKMVGNRK